MTSRVLCDCVLLFCFVFQNEKEETLTTNVWIEIVRLHQVPICVYMHMYFIMFLHTAV